MKLLGRAMLKELIEMLEKAGSKQLIMLSKSETKVMIGALKSYDNLLKRLEGDYREEIEE